MVYVVLYTNAQGYLASNSFSEHEKAQDRLDELNKVNGVKGARILTDVVESPYKELYEKLYNDFVKPMIATNNTPKVEHTYQPIKAIVKE